MHNTTQSIIINFIILEFILVFIFVGLVYVFKIYSKIKLQINLKSKKKLEALIEQYKVDGDLKPLKRFNNAPLLISMLSTHQLPATMKKEISKEVLLPEVANYCHSKDWKKRYLILNCFNYYIDESYYPCLIQLIKDDVSIVSVNAGRIGSSIANEDIYNAILKYLENHEHSNRVLHISNLQTNKKMWPYLLSTLENTNDTLLKSTIYKILLHTGCDSTFYEMTKYDSVNGADNMQLSAIRLLPHTDPDKAQAPLESLAKSSNWLIRNIAIQSLAVIKNPNSISLIGDALEDEEKWVRISAVKALISYEEKGHQFLKNFNEKKPGTFPGYTDYFLKINNIKG